MATPRFVAKKVGDQYVLERKDKAGCCEDMLFASIGGVIALCGIARGGVLGKVASFVGGSMICRGITGKNPFARFATHSRDRQLRSQPSASHQNDARPTEQRPEDHVDEAAMESFPASDPPARSAVSSVGASA